MFGKNEKSYARNFYLNHLKSLKLTGIVPIKNAHKASRDWGLYWVSKEQELNYKQDGRLCG